MSKDIYGTKKNTKLGTVPPCRTCRNGRSTCARPPEIVELSALQYHQRAVGFRYAGTLYGKNGKQSCAKAVVPIVVYGDA